MAFLLIIVLSLVSVVVKKLTIAGAFVGAAIAALLFAGVGMEGLVYLAIFFTAGVAVTAHGRSKKIILSGTSEYGPRTAGQVIANGGVSALLAMIAITNPSCQQLIAFLIACSLASATADTLSSELGTLYGKRFFNSISFAKDQRGLDGVVSLEGILIGILSTLFIAMTYHFIFDGAYKWWMIVLAGTLGNYMDSVLGATLERRRLINNDVVNFINTAVGALMGWGLTLFSP